jgi:Uma2 family endonuclease
MAQTTVVAGTRLADAPNLPSPPSRMTFEEFMAWAGEDTLAELAQGEIVMMTPASILHQDLLKFLTRVLSDYVEVQGLGWVGAAPIAMRLSPDTAREPDLLFVSNDHLERVKQTYVDGPADLVIEIVSADSVGRDRGEKYYEYEQAGIAEYWLIDSRTRRAEFYQLQDAYYHPILPDAQAIYRSRMLPGFWLNVNWLQQEPLPAVEDVLLDVGGQDYAAQLIERLRKRGFLPS